jgi:Amt family ammonium transporter
VVFGVLLLDKAGVDDPVGAIAVHGLNGTVGTLAVGLWGRKALGLARDGLFAGGGPTQLGVQLVGNLTVILFAAGSMALVFWLVKKTVGLRVSKEEELRGLDIGEHGNEAYAGFQVFTTT